MRAALTRAAYGEARFPQPVVPVTGLDDVADGLVLVGLSEGPTMAFKDLAMQFLGQAIPYVLAKQGRVLNILGTTPPKISTLLPIMSPCVTLIV